MDKVLDLRNKKNYLSGQAKSLHQKYSADAAWSAEDLKKFDDLMDETERTSATIRAHEKMAEDANESLIADAVGDIKSIKSDAKNVLAKYLRNGAKSLTKEDIDVLGPQVSNAMSTGVGAEGGFTVPQTLAAVLIEKLKAFGGMRSVANVYSTDSGEQMNLPTYDGTAEIGEWIAENATTAALDMTFGTRALVTHMSSSRSIAMPWQLVADSGIEIVNAVTNQLSVRIARLQNLAFTNGSGVGQPHGVTVEAGTGVVGLTGSATTITYDSLVNLMHSIDPAFRVGTLSIMANDLTVAEFRKIKDASGRPLFVPGYESALASAAPDRIMGVQIVVNQAMPVMAANAKSIAYGDFSGYHIRDVNGSAFIRRFDDSAFALKQQVGFCSWQRVGGRLINVDMIKLYQNSAT